MSQRFAELSERFMALEPQLPQGLERVEDQHHRPTPEVRKPDMLALRVGQGEIWSRAAHR